MVAPAPVAPQRHLAAQWRFACRVLRRLAPEERVQDMRRQLRLGDHVLLRYSWDNSELHGIICSNAGQEARRDRQDPHWVVHWDGSSSSLQRTQLSQLCKGGELARVTYPHWACRLLMPMSSTARPQVVEECILEPAADEAVARRANSALRAGWAPRWAQSGDLEFCLDAKTAGAGPTWELHGRSTLSSRPLATLGCQVRGDRQPSVTMGTRPGGGSRGAVGAAPWGLPCGASPLPAQVLTVNEVEAAYGHAGPAAAGSTTAATESTWGAAWWEAGGGGWGQAGAGAQGCRGAGAPALAAQGHKAPAGSNLSADAEVFVPQGRGNWDGIYQ